MLITWVGHATTLIEIDGVRIITDPLLRNRVTFLIRHGQDVLDEWSKNIDAVVVSHLHHDHLDVPSLRLLKGDPLVVAPRGSLALLTEAGIDNVEELSVGETTAIRDVKISATFAEHGRFRVPLGPSTSAMGYVLEGSRRIYFAGDTGLFPEMEGLGGALDLALLPVGGWGPTSRSGHLDPWTAMQALKLLRPRVAVPIHWGTFWIAGLRKLLNARFSRPGPEFARLTSLHCPQTRVCLTSPGQAVVLPRDF